MRATRPSVRVRNATEQDLPAIADLDAEAFPDAPYPGFVLRQFCDAFVGRLLVADDGGHLWGYVLATPPNGARSWILSLGVAKDKRRHGLGRRLMVETLNRLRSEGVRTVQLSVEPGNDVAIALYTDLGFVADSATPLRDYFGPGEHRLIMTLTL